MKKTVLMGTSKNPTKEGLFCPQGKLQIKVIRGSLISILFLLPVFIINSLQIPSPVPFIKGAYGGRYYFKMIPCKSGNAWKGAKGFMCRVTKHRELP
ncbi:MAG: hypothetical protein KAS64_09605 [Spirochaetes bacterium]|nr:hypothetical protein [Spirochaetota bacterium]